MSYRFNANARLYAFTDGSGLAIYSDYAGDTVCLKAATNVQALTEFIQKQRFVQCELAQALGISDKEAVRVLEYLQDNHLIDNISGS